MSDAQKPGRPVEFTPELGRRICVRIAKTGFEAIAAERCGVHRNTLTNWKRRGEAGEEPFAHFARELAAAKSRCMESLLEKVDDERWKLERMDRAQFGAAHKVEHTGEDGRPIALAHKHEHTLSREQALEIVSKVLGVAKQLVEGKFKGRQLEEESSDD